MNERILELAIKAREYTESKPDIYQVAYDKKFAELLIRECADLFDPDSTVEHEEWIVRKIILRHFGVKE